MLEPILQSLRDVEGVQGAMVVDAGGNVLAARAHSVYDLSVLQQVARAVVGASDAVQLIQDDWDLLTGHFTEGKLLLRSLRVPGTKRRYLLVVIADATLNVAFLGVALRVAAGKLITLFETSPETSFAAGSASVVPPASGRIPVPLPAHEPSRPELARSGLSWSGTGNLSSSSVAGSGVQIADQASAQFLSGATRALAANIGPVAKMLVKEAVRAVCGDRPFSRADGPALLAHLANGITNQNDRATFQKATRSL